MSQLPSVTPATNHRSQSSTFDGSPPDASDTSSPNNNNNNSNASSAAASSPSVNEPRQYLPLNQRIPDTDAVLKVVRSKQKVNHMLEYSIFVNEEDRVVLFNKEFWEQYPYPLLMQLHYALPTIEKKARQ